MAKDIFFTGFPGFLGRELLPRVLLREPGASAVCLVQERYLREAEGVVRELTSRHPELRRRVELVVGDITRPDLGLGADGSAHAERTRDIYHLAAVYDLSVGRELAHQVNVVGTRHVLDFAEACPGLRRHHYVSTCYVSGRHCGIFRERDLARGQAFNNFYEETKHLAEVEVRRRPRVPSTVYRPSIVVGDQHTGKTQKFDGPYFMLQWLLRQPAAFAVMPVVADATAVRFNVVPRDFVVQAIAALSLRDDNVGRTYQLADPEPLTVHELLSAAEVATGRRMIRLPVPIGLAKGALDRVPLLGDLVRIPSSAVSYFAHPCHYDTSGAEQALAGTGIEVPRLDRYLDKLVGFVRDNPGMSSAAMV